MATSSLDAIAGLPLFSKLSTRQLRRLLKGSSQDTYEAGVTIVRQGGRSSSLFVVVEGSATVERDGQQITTIGPGEFFGEISMIDGRASSASVVADSPMVCVVIFQESLRKLVMKEPAAAWLLMQTLASRLRGE